MVTKVNSKFMNKVLNIIRWIFTFLFLSLTLLAIVGILPKNTFFNSLIIISLLMNSIISGYVEKDMFSTTYEKTLGDWVQVIITLIVLLVLVNFVSKTVPQAVELFIGIFLFIVIGTEFGKKRKKSAK